MKSVMNLMNVINVGNGEWRRWAVLLLGAGLFASTWVLGASGEQASSINAWIVGICLILVAWRLPVLYGPPAVAGVGAVLGVWLLVSPFALAFAGSSEAWVGWSAGALTVALSVTPESVFDLAAWIQAWRLRRDIHRVSPYQIARAEEPEQTISPQRLCRRIVECSHQIHRALLHQPTETEIEMCILGYRACVSDIIKLSCIIDAERLVSGIPRRWRLELARRQSAHALSRAWKRLPPQARRTQRQSEV